MPNFKCKSVKELSLPFEKDGVCFEWLGQNERTRLIYNIKGEQKGKNKGAFAQLIQKQIP